jgi:hypothetical protein
MIDFKALVEKIRDANGYCSLPSSKYATVPGVVTDCITGKHKGIDCPWFIEEEKDGKKVLRLLNGPTGWESWYLEDLRRYWKDSDTFCACAGTEGRWDRLVLDSAAVKEIVFGDFNASRRVRAGRDEVMGYEEKVESLKGTGLGEILGV